jgi:hypothetical protein
MRSPRLVMAFDPAPAVPLKSCRPMKVGPRATAGQCCDCPARRGGKAHQTGLRSGLCQPTRQGEGQDQAAARVSERYFDGAHPVAEWPGGRARTQNVSSIHTRIRAGAKDGAEGGAAALADLSRFMEAPALGDSQKSSDVPGRIRPTGSSRRRTKNDRRPAVAALRGANRIQRAQRRSQNIFEPLPTARRSRPA